MVTVSEETAVDYELTARIATEAFALGDVHFSAERIKWLYERGFGRGTTVLAAIDDGRKIGQVALIGQNVCVAGEIHPAVRCSRRQVRPLPADRFRLRVRSEACSSGRPACFST
jgi:hypothetical protein